MQNCAWVRVTVSPSGKFAVLRNRSRASACLDSGNWLGLYHSSSTRSIIVTCCVSVFLALFPNIFKCIFYASIFQIVIFSYWRQSMHWPSHNIFCTCCDRIGLTQMGLVSPVLSHFILLSSLHCKFVAGSSWVGFFVLPLFIVFSGCADLPTIAWV